jgi:hypothetical protein
LEEEHLHISLGTEEKVECHHAFGIFPVNHMCQQLHPKNIPIDINTTYIPYINCSLFFSFLSYTVAKN